MLCPWCKKQVTSENWKMHQQAHRKPTGGQQAMSTDKSDEWEPWESTLEGFTYYGINVGGFIVRTGAGDAGRSRRDRILADHAAARDLAQAQERIRELEAALWGMIDHLHNPFPDGTPKDGYTMKGHGIAYAAAVRHARTLLLSPAAATEGGEEA